MFSTLKIGSLISIVAKRIQIQNDTKLVLSAYFKYVYSDKLRKFSYKKLNKKRYLSIFKRIPPE